MSTRVRCGQCEGCRGADCGQCRSCLGKRKFGGDGSSHKACELRRCSIGLQQRLSSSYYSTVQSTSDDYNDKRISSEPVPKKRRILQKQMYGVPCPLPVENVCAGCFGERNEELQHDAILLCDGEQCSYEYHMSCCLPALANVPQGEFYCVHCDPLGSTAQLKDYFERTAESRATFATSKEFVDSLCLAQVTTTEPRIPRSELERMAESHRDVFVWRGDASEKKTREVPLGPEFLVGKPLRLYSPVGNQYHNGRILDLRHDTHLGSSSTTANAFHGTSEVARCEFLVTFPAGMDYRKETLHQWIILEEHSLAVGASLIWGQLDQRTGLKGWAPGQTWLRTSLELIPVRNMLSEPQLQISFLDRPKPAPKNQTWALAKFFAEETYALLSLTEESANFFHESFSRHRADTVEASLTKRTADRCDLALALAHAEAEEQNRVFQWHGMPLRNPTHKRALTIAEEAALPHVAISNIGSQDDEDELTSKPCQLIPQGLDRMYLMKMLRNRGVEMSKDTAASISCRRVVSTTASISQLRARAKSSQRQEL